MSKTFGIFACGEIGRLAVKVFTDRKEQLKFVLLNPMNHWNWNNKIIEELKDFKGTKIYYYTNDSEILPMCKKVDAVILAFWGEIIKDELLDAPSFGYINLHTSFLPYGKGKHPHYWSLVEEKPYGVTIMKIDSGLDTGKIIFQKKIDVSWTDTGETLYFKAFRAMDELLYEKRNQILELDFDLKDQKEIGTFHYGREIDKSSMIDLNKTYTAKKLLNILRARTFRPFPAAYFWDDGKKYEITVQITEVKKELDISKIDYEKIAKDGQKQIEN